MSNAEKEFLSTARPLGESLMAYAMGEGKAFGITDVKVAISSSDSQENNVEKGEVVKVVSGKTYKVQVALYAGDRTLSFSKNTLDETILRDAVMKNMQVIHLVPGNADKRLLEKEKVYKGPQVDLDLYDQTQPDQETLIAYAKELEAAALAQPKIKTTDSVAIGKDNNFSLIVATNGLDRFKAGTAYQAIAEMIAEDESGMQTGYDYSVARHFSDMSAPRELGERAGQNAAAKLSATLPQTGQMPVVLDHAAAEAFFSLVYKAIDGTEVNRGATFLKGKIGEQVMSAGVTLVDDPLLARGKSSSQVDTSGVESKKITFIEDGVLKGYNVSLLESRQLGIEPIGRNDGPTNSRVLPGSQTPEELISDIQEGIYIKGFNGGSVDVNNGTHSRQAYGKLIKDGKITDIAVDGFVVSGNLKEMFMNVVLANDTPEQPHVRHTLVAPTTRINGVTIAGK